MSSPATLSNTGSLLSNTGRAEQSDNGWSDNKCPSSHLNNSASMKVHEAYGTGTRAISDTLNLSVVDMGRGDIDLQVNNIVFKTHMHLLCNFTRFEEMIQSVERHSPGSIPSIILYRDERGVEDITNTFKILYASVIKGPLEFDPPVLISALRISTVYGYPELRAFSIKHLEEASLGVIQRIQLAREFNLTSWEGPAHDELSKRDEAITDEEAQILGIVAFTKVARAREDEKLKKGKEIGEREYKMKTKKEKEEKERKEEEKVKKEAEEKAKKEAEEKARKVAEERARRETEGKAKKAAEEKAKKEAEEKAKKEAEENARRQAEEDARRQAEEDAWRQAELEEIARQQACYDDYDYYDDSD